jgi:RNA polymerase sigma-70 factor (sigma-E family)
MMAVGVRTVSRGEERSGRLDELYVRHFPGAVGLAYLLTGNREEAEDLAQEAFVRLAGRFRHLRDPLAFGAYLRKTVVNLHLSGLRRLRVERAYVARHRADVVEMRSDMPDVAGRSDLWGALQALPPRQRAAIVLRYYEDLSERETAEVMRCSVAAVKSLVTRSMATLRNELRGEDE